MAHMLRAFNKKTFMSHLKNKQRNVNNRQPGGPFL